MKKLFFISVAVLGLSACSDAGIGVDHDQKLITPERVYEVDGWGADPDIYEFTPVGHEHMTCLIVVSGSDKTGGMECFPKKFERRPRI